MGILQPIQDLCVTVEKLGWSTEILGCVAMLPTTQTLGLWDSKANTHFVNTLHHGTQQFRNSQMASPWLQATGRQKLAARQVLVFIPWLRHH